MNITSLLLCIKIEEKPSFYAGYDNFCSIITHSSMRRTIPVAFIYNSPVNVIFGIRRIMRRNALKKVFR